MKSASYKDKKKKVQVIRPILAIQRKCLLNNVVKNFVSCKQIFDNLNSFLNLDEQPMFITKTEHLSKSYDRLKLVLQDKDVIKQITTLVSSVNRYHKISKTIVSSEITSKKMLIAWLIASFPEFTIEMEKDKITDIGTYPGEVYHISGLFIESLNNFRLCYSPENGRLFRKHIVFSIINRYI